MHSTTLSSPVNPSSTTRLPVPMLQQQVQRIYDMLLEEIVQPAVELGASESEFSLLETLCLCIPVSTLSDDAKQSIRSAQAHYQAVFARRMESRARWRHRLGKRRPSLEANNTDNDSPICIDTGSCTVEGEEGSVQRCLQRMSKMVAWLAAIERIACEAERILLLEPPIPPLPISSHRMAHASHQDDRPLQ